MKIFLLLLAASLLSLNAWAANEPARQPGAAVPAQRAVAQGQAAPSPLIGTMVQELDREMPILSKANPPAYFISYILTSTDRSEVMGSNGALLSSEESRSRWLLRLNGPLRNWTRTCLSSMRPLSRRACSSVTFSSALPWF